MMCVICETNQDDVFGCVYFCAEHEHECLHVAEVFKRATKAEAEIERLRKLLVEASEAIDAATSNDSFFGGRPSDDRIIEIRDRVSAEISPAPPPPSDPSIVKFVVKS